MFRSETHSNRTSLRWRSAVIVALFGLPLAACGQDPLAQEQSEPVQSVPVQSNPEGLRAAEEVLSAFPSLDQQQPVAPFDRPSDVLGHDVPASPEIVEVLNIERWRIYQVEATGSAFLDVEGYSDQVEGPVVAWRLNVDEPLLGTTVRIADEEYHLGDDATDEVVDHAAGVRAVLKMFSFELGEMLGASQRAPSQASDAEHGIGRSVSSGTPARIICAFYTVKLQIDIGLATTGCIAAAGNGGINPFFDTACIVPIVSIAGDVTNIINACGSSPHIPGYLLPRGSYRNSCNMNTCIYKNPAVTLQCSCRTIQGSYRTSTKRLSSSCFPNKLHNCNGILTCGNGCP